MVQWLRLPELPLQGTWVRSPVRELRSRICHAVWPHTHTHTHNVKRWVFKSYHQWPLRVGGDHKKGGPSSGTDHFLSTSAASVRPGGDQAWPCSLRVPGASFLLCFSEGYHPPATTSRVTVVVKSTELGSALGSMAGLDRGFLGQRPRLPPSGPPPHPAPGVWQALNNS